MKPKVLLGVFGSAFFVVLASLLIITRFAPKWHETHQWSTIGGSVLMMLMLMVCATVAKRI